MKILNLTLVSCRSSLIEHLQLAGYEINVYKTPLFFLQSKLKTAQLLIVDEENFNQEIENPRLYFSAFDGLKICITKETCQARSNLIYNFFDYIIPGPCNSTMLSRLVDIYLAEISIRSDLLNYPVAEIAKKEMSLDGLFPGVSDVMYKLHEKIKMAAANDSPVLLLGETGTGKTRAAQLIHELSSRKNRRFKSFDMSDMVESLSESQFFGTEAHAYTDAVKSDGILDEADGGTLFIDEIGNANLEIQANLLSVTENKTKVRVGGTKPEAVDVRMIFATNADLKRMMRTGLFKSDLYYRIYDNSIIIPPLREHLVDIKCMVKNFCESENIEVSNESLLLLERHKWPGNFREFKKCLWNAKQKALNHVILPEHLEFGLL